jgi:hypothetical protein
MTRRKIIRPNDFKSAQSIKSLNVFTFIQIAQITIRPYLRLHSPHIHITFLKIVYLKFLTSENVFFL